MERAILSHARLPVVGMSRLLQGFIILSLLWLPHSVAANDRVFLAGVEASQRDYYSYVGVVLPGPGCRNGKGFFQRYWLDRFGYEYEAGPFDVDADAWGGEAALGYVTPTARGWWSVSAGLRYTDTDLSPDDRNASARGGQLSPKIQVETEARLDANWRAAVIASFTVEQSQYWGRLRALRKSAPRWSMGGELTLGGNDEYDSVGVAAVALWQPNDSPWNLAIKAGQRFQDGGDGVFIGTEVGRSF